MRQRSGFSDQAKWSLAILPICLIGISACSSSSDKPSADDDPGTIPTLPGDDDPVAPDALVAPEIERIAVYSGTAAELFWQRPPQGSPVARVEVSRDNLVLGSTNGTSFFDDSRSPGVDYEYTLVAIAADGQRSDGGVPDPGSDGDGLDVIRADNIVTLIAAVFDAYRGEPWADQVFALPGFSRTPQQIPFDEQVLACDNGGTATITFDHVGSQDDRRYVFDNCQDGETVLDGDFYFYDYLFRNFISETGLAVERPTETIYYTGHLQKTRDAPNRKWFRTVEPVTFERRASDGSVYSLSAKELDFSYGFIPKGPPYEVVRLSGALTVASERTGNLSVSAETPESLHRPPTACETGSGCWYAPLPDNWTFTEGSLRVTAPAGSAVLVEADNGDETSARLTLIDSSGERESFDAPWSAWQVNLRFD